MKNISAGLVVALLLALVVGAGLIQAFANFTGGIELRPATPALLAPATMSVGAPENPNSANNTFDVTVNIADATNLGAYEYDLGFDNTILSVNSVAQGTFLSSTGRDMIPLGPLTDTLGVVSVGAATCPVADCGSGPEQIRITEGVTGTGTLATTKFDVVGRGVTTLTLTIAQITDVDANVQGLNTSNATIGVFPTTLYPGSASSFKYNALSVPVSVQGVTTAPQLATYLGPGVVALLKWDNTSQVFQFYPGDDFGVNAGDFLFAALNDTASTNVLFANVVPSPPVSFILQRGGSPCSYNFITIPLNQTGITKAPDLTVIGGLVAALKWDNATQVFQFYPGDDFELNVGDPVIVCLNNSAGGPSWP